MRFSHWKSFFTLALAAFAVLFLLIRSESSEAGAVTLASYQLEVIHQGTNILVYWPGRPEEQLQSAPNANGPWATISDAANPYEEPVRTSVRKFFRTISPFPP